MAILFLGDISTIQIGLILARKKAEEGSLYTHQQLTLRSLENNNINLEATKPYYSEEPIRNKCMTKTGTIVMKLFFPFNPVVITKETEGYLIPSQMVSVEPGKSVLPEYLCLYLSQDFVAERLLVNYFGIAQRAITVKSLLNLEIKVPSLKKQHTICDYYKSYHQLCQLRKKLEQEEPTMMKFIFSILSKDKEYS
ncbi:MAG: restriction endonuclease subunit S [Treponema sp.]|jgi:restriction endonuclease S subunit|nr:restriction endonuclease subunit S [Treponema sp.]